MAYSTDVELKTACGGDTRFVQLFDWNQDGVADADQIAAKVSEADALINSYLSKVRRVPIVNPPDSMKRISARLAVYFARSARGMLDQATVEAYDRDVLWLKGVSDGTIALDADPQPLPTSMRVDASTPISSLRDVSRKKLHGFS